MCLIKRVCSASWPRFEALGDADRCGRRRRRSEDRAKRLRRRAARGSGPAKPGGGAAGAAAAIDIPTWAYFSLPSPVFLVFPLFLLYPLVGGSLWNSRNMWNIVG